MSLKAAEAGIVLPFVVNELMVLGGPAVFGAMLIGAGTSLLAFCRKIKSCKVIVGPQQYKELMLSLDAFLMCAKSSNLTLTGKAHQLAHLVQRTWEYHES